MPETIAVKVNPGVSLAPGTYTGQVVFTSQSGAVSLTVPVTLTIAGSGATFLDNLPGQMSFSLKTGGLTPPSQSFQIRNGVSGALSWTLGTSTSDGGNWLSVSALSGSAPSIVTISLLKVNLPGQGFTAGTFIGQVVVQGGGSSTTIPVSVVVGDNVFSQVNAINFTKPYSGANPLPQTLTVASTGNSFAFTASVSTATGGNWFTVDNVSYGNCSLCTLPQSINVIVNASPTLPVGIYTGQIVFTSQTGNQSITVPVSLTVADAGVPFFDNLPGQLSFSFITAGLAPPAQSLQISNGGAGQLDWTAKGITSDGGTWLTISGAGGTAPSLFTVGISRVSLPYAGLVAGTFTGEVLFQSANSSVTVPISVVLGDNVFRQINTINFTKPYAGANPLPQTLTVASTGTTFNFTVSVSTANGGSWLSVDNVSYGNCALCPTPQSIRAIVNASPTLAAGTYTGQILLISQVGSLTITVPVTLTVTDPATPFFDNLPGQMSFSLKTTGLAPPGQSIQVRNGGLGTLSWTLGGKTADGGAWLSISALSGTAPSLVTVSILKQNLPGQGLIAGTFSGELVFRSAGSSVSVPVSVVVGDNVFYQINAISFTKPYQGANPLPQTLTVASTGTSFNFTFTASTATGGPWLSVDNASYGNCALCSTPQAIRAIVNASPTMAVGTYTGEIVLTAQNGSLAITVGVTLTVADPAASFFDNVPGQMSFSMKTGGFAPPAQSLQIRNGGAGALGWTLSTSTADGGNWLSASTLGGTAPSLLSVSLLKQNLPGQGLIAGTFYGELVFQSVGSSVTVPVSVVVGDNVFYQVNAIHFTKPAGGADPLPQTLTIASTGTNFNFTAAASTATGGPWLTVDNVSYGNCALCSTPETITAVVAASPTLAAGTYTGQIVFTAQTGSQVITVPVSLTVADTAGPLFDDVPGQMSFFLATGSGNPASHQIPIRNGGAGTLNWTLAASTSDGGNWLTVSAPAGIAPTSVTVGVLASALPGAGLSAGTFTGELVFQGPGSSVTVPVSVTVGTSVFAQLGSLSFTEPVGGPNPLSQVLNIASTSAAFNFNVTKATGKGGNWLSAATAGSCILCAIPKVVTASVAGATLAGGSYTGQIVLTSQNGGMAMTVPVTLTVGTIPPPAPLVVLVTPNLAQVGQTVTSVSILGQDTNFAQGTTVASFGAGITVNSLTVNSATAAVANITIQNGAALGPRDVAMTTGAEVASLSNAFTVLLNPVVSIAKTHTGNFAQGQNGVTYSISVSNAGGAGPTSGMVTLTEAPPPGLTLVSMAGTGWACPAGGVTCTRSDALAPGSSYPTVTVVANVASNAPSQFTNQASVTVGGFIASASDLTLIAPAGALRFIPVTPCRVADTRKTTGPFGAPAIAGGTSRDFIIPNSACSIPVTAQAYSLNVAVVPPGALGFLTLWPAGQTRPVASTLNSLDGRIKSVAAIVPAGTGGAVSVFASNTTNLVLDINGYFVSAADTTALAFYPVTPCRIVDTRKPAGLLTGPSLVGQQSRTFPIQTGNCNLPAVAQAYSLNFAAVPSGPLGFLTAFPTGQTRPVAANLNALTGTVTANAALVPAGANGSIDVFASNTTDLVIDVNGYFAPMNTGGLSLYGVTPCRVVDTRQPVGSPPITAQDLNVSASACGIASSAQAYVFSATVVPPGALGFLTLWPQGQTRPTVSTLNASDAAITSNMAIVPTTNGSISIFASNPTQLVMDISGYFGQ